MQLLTLGCGKFRILDQEFGTLADTGLPRLLDMGQCNDAYSALVVATVSTRVRIGLYKLLYRVALLDPECSLG